MAVNRNLRRTSCALEMSQLSTEYIYVTITAEPGTEPVTASSILVDMAFMSRDSQPTAPDWNPADLTDDNGAVVAGVLIGPGSTVGALTPGAYGVWIRITEASETPVRKVGSLTIF